MSFLDKKSANQLGWTQSSLISQQLHYSWKTKPEIQKKFRSDTNYQ